MLAFLNTPTFPVFSPPTYFNPAFILRFYLSFIFYLAFIYCVLLFTNIIYHVMRTDTCNKPHTLRDAVTGRNRNLPVCELVSSIVHCETNMSSDTETGNRDKINVLSPILNNLNIELGVHDWLYTFNPCMGYFISPGIDTRWKGPTGYSVSSERHGQCGII